MKTALLMIFAFSLIASTCEIEALEPNFNTKTCCNYKGECRVVTRYAMCPRGYY